MAPTEQSSPLLHNYTIGYALLPSKVDSVIQPSLIALAAERGMRLVAVDVSRPLADQGPFDLLIHKLYDRPWRAQLEAFSALHPSVPVVDPPAAIDRLLDRVSMLDVISELSLSFADAECSVGVPSQVAVHDAAALAVDTDNSLLGALRFPLIAKPLAVDGSAGSHAMSLVYRRDGLLGLRPPLLLQEFINHGGVLFKVYVVGDRATCVRRRSLPDVPGERLLDLDDDPSVPFANVSNLLVPAAAGDNAEMPPAGFVDEVARGLRRALGLHLFNFDMIRARELDGGRQRYFPVDINYFPGYAKVPGYETALTDFFSEMLHARPVVDAQLGPASSLAIAVHKLEPVRDIGTIEAEPGQAQA